MKKILFIKLISILILLTSCISNDANISKEVPKVTGQEIHLPDWVMDPKIKDGIAAVGISAPTRGGYRFQIPKAEADAKANIAGILQSEISRVTKNALRESKLNDVNDVGDKNGFICSQYLVMVANICPGSCDQDHVVKYLTRL